MILVRTIPKTFVTKRLCFTGVVDKLLIDYVKFFFQDSGYHYCSA